MRYKLLPLLQSWTGKHFGINWFFGKLNKFIKNVNPTEYMHTLKRDERL